MPVKFGGFLEKSLWLFGKPTATKKIWQSAFPLGAPLVSGRRLGLILPSITPALTAGSSTGARRRLKSALAGLGGNGPMPQFVRCPSLILEKFLNDDFTFRQYWFEF